MGGRGEGEGEPRNGGEEEGGGGGVPLSSTSAGSGYFRSRAVISTFFPDLSLSSLLREYVAVFFLFHSFVSVLYLVRYFRYLLFKKKKKKKEGVYRGNEVEYVRGMCG